MNPFNLIVFAIASAAAMPQGYGGGATSAPQKKCEWRTVVEYQESTRKECQTLYETKCSTLYKKVCTPYEDEVCTSYQRKQCDQKQRTKYRVWSEEVCKDKYVTHCDKHWEEDAYGAKHWVDDKSTCKEIVDGKTCNNVQRKEPYQEDYEDCYNVPDEKCRYVTKQSCKEEPYQECKRVPYQDCENIHEKKPHQVRRRYCNGKKVSGSGSGSGSGSNDYDDYEDNNGGTEVFDVRNTGTEQSGSLGTKEVIDTRSEDNEDVTTDDSAIKFGK